jgi:hypothetical protein
MKSKHFSTEINNKNPVWRLKDQYGPAGSMKHSMDKGLTCFIFMDSHQDRDRVLQ